MHPTTTQAGLKLEISSPWPAPSLRLLAVDDAEVNRKFLRAVLESEGHSVLEAGDGVEALRILERERIDLVISDILMPNMDGYRLCYEIRNRAAFQSMPILIYTATFTSPNDERFALDAGADLYLRKPASSAELLAAIARILASAKSRPGRFRPPLGDAEMAKQYSEVLIHKLEAKNLELTERTERLKEAERQLRQMASRLESVREEEATCISRELHDELGQALTALNIDLHWLRERTEQVENEPMRRKMRERINSMLAAVESTVHSVQRISAELRPSMLDHLGLLATLEWLVNDFAARTECSCEWKAKPANLALDALQSATVFRIFREALTNIARHAKAKRVTVTFEQNADGMRLEITDDGEGFPADRLADPASLGLTGMRERALLVAGRLEVQSAPGRGTSVKLWVPSSIPCAF